MVRHPIRTSNGVRPRTPAPALGADTNDVLRAIGLDDQRLEALRAAGVIGGPAGYDNQREDRTG